MLRHSRKIAGALLVAAIAGAAYLAVVLSGNRQEILDALTRLQPTTLALILALSLVNYLLRFMRWHGYIATLGHALPFWRHLACYVAGFTFTVTPGKAGEAVRAVYLKPHGVSYMDSLAALFMERLLDVLVIAALAALAISALPDSRNLVIGSLALVAAACWVAGMPQLSRVLRRMEHHVRSRKIGTVVRHTADMLESSGELRRPRPLATGLLLGFAAWGAEAVALSIILQSLGTQMPVSVAAGIYALSVLAGTLSMLPGGLGGTELAMGLMLGANGVAPATAVAATLICRLTTLWFAVALGGMAVAWLGFRGVLPSHEAKGMS